MLKTVWSEAMGRSRTAWSPSWTHPMAGPSATPSSRILRSQPLELGPEVVVEDRLDARVVELVQVDAVGPEPSEGVVELLADGFGPPVLRSLGLAGEGARRLDVVAALRGDHEVVAVRLEQIGQHRLADGVRSIDRCRVDEVDARIDRGTQHGGLVVDRAPPVAGEGPGAEPDLRDLERRSTETPVTHGGPPLLPHTTR
jgi:hypothetical protein